MRQDVKSFAENLCFNPHSVIKLSATAQAYAQAYAQI